MNNRKTSDFDMSDHRPDFGLDLGVNDRGDTTSTVLDMLCSTSRKI